MVIMPEMELEPQKGRKERASGIEFYGNTNQELL